MSRASVVGIAVAVAAAAVLCAWATVATAAPVASFAPASTSTATAPPPAPIARPSGIAIVVRDRVELRAAPRDSANQLATLWQGEALEVRGERLDHLQVWDYHRERGGYVRANQVHRLSSTREPDAPALLAVLRFVRDTPGAESLGIGIAAAWLRAAPAEQVRGAAGIEVFDALGGFADRLAQRASAGAGGNKSAEQRIAAHLDVAARYGVKFRSFERDQQVQVCYDGEAFHRVLAATSAEPGQKARAALALTRAECIDPALGVTARAEVDAWRAATLDRVDPTALAALSQALRNRVAMQRASVWSAIAFRRARHGEPAIEAAQRSLDELGRVVAGELTDDDLPVFHDAAMRVNATRWAAQPAATPALRGLAIRTVAGEPGQTCVELVESRTATSADAPPTGAPLARRCTWAQVWVASATSSREGNAVALAVQPGEAWRELWLFRRVGRAWTVDVLPPASVLPTAASLGYAEFAGWVPGGSQVLVARESRGDGRYRRSFEVMRLTTLAPDRQSGDPAALGAFQRWQDAAWKRDSVAVR